MLTWSEFNTSRASWDSEWRLKNREARKNVWSKYVQSLDNLECLPLPRDNYVFAPTPIVTATQEALDLYEEEEEEKERTMYATTATAFTQNINTIPQAYDSCEFVCTRIKEEASEKKDLLRKKFHLNTVSPGSIKELKEWIAKGDYYFDVPKDWEDDTECYALGYFYWGQKPDRKGYKLAVEKLDKAMQDALDLVRIKTDEDTRLKALQDFQSATFH